MGNDSSRHSAKSKSNFNDNELAILTAKLTKSGNNKSICKSDFMKFTGLGKIASILFDAISRTKQEIEIFQIVQALNKIYGDVEEEAEQLLKIHHNGKQAVKDYVDVFSAKHNLTDVQTDAFFQFITQDIPENDTLFHRWLMSSPLTCQLIHDAYNDLIGKPASIAIPCLSGETRLINSTASVVAINAHLPMDRRTKWTNLFSSETHGSSFSQLYNNVNGEGPCILLVESTKGYIFGCFASEGFISGPQYRGDATSFLFQLMPSLSIFSATGMLSDYAYLNSQQASLPNGLGMGGYEGNWPLFICEEFGRGIATPNMTGFEKCSLAGEDAFTIKYLEVWRVGEKPRLTVDEEEHLRSQKSVIDKDPEAKALLEMSGKKMYSEAHREAKPILDN